MQGQQSMWDMPPAPQKPEPQPPVFELPLNTGKVYPITAAMVEKWVKVYPAVNVMHELKAMRTWFYDDHRRLITKRGIGGFIAHWLGKHQNVGGAPTYTGVPAKKHPETVCGYTDDEINEMLMKVTF